MDLSPRHLQLREMLFRRWKTNGAKVGDRIESQNEIIKFCDFSLITVIKTLKDLEAEGVIGAGKLYPAYYVIPGNQGSPAVMRRVGQEIAADLKKDNVEGVIFVAT